MNKIKTLFSNLFLSLIAFLFVFIISGVCTGFYINNLAGEQGFKKYAALKQSHNKKNKIKYTPHPYLRYYPTPNYTSGQNKHNSMRYRGNELKNVANEKNVYFFDLKSLFPEDKR